MKVKMLLFLILIFGVGTGVAFAADPASTNYQVLESYCPAGLGAGESVNYKIGEGSVDFFNKAAAASTNYSVDGKVGIMGAELIAEISGVSPSEYSSFYHDENASYTVTATTLDGDNLQYRAKQDATVKDGPQISENLSWALAAGDVGRHTMQFDVIDPDGTVNTQRDAYIFRRPTK